MDVDKLSDAEVLKLAEELGITKTGAEKRAETLGTDLETYKQASMAEGFAFAGFHDELQVLSSQKESAEEPVPSDEAPKESAPEEEKSSGIANLIAGGLGGAGLAAGGLALYHGQKGREELKGAIESGQTATRRGLAALLARQKYNEMRDVHNESRLARGLNVNRAVLRGLFEKSGK